MCKIKCIQNTYKIYVILFDMFLYIEIVNLPTCSGKCPPPPPRRKVHAIIFSGFL